MVLGKWTQSKYKNQIWKKNARYDDFILELGHGIKLQLQLPGCTTDPPVRRSGIGGNDKIKMRQWIFTFPVQMEQKAAVKGRACLFSNFSLGVRMKQGRLFLSTVIIMSTENWWICTNQLGYIALSGWYGSGFYFALKIEEGEIRLK